MGFSSWLIEFSGSFGDLGTLLPITIALVKAIKLDFGTTIIANGVYNFLTGWYFGVPIAVQPMTTIAALAIQKQLSVNEVCLAGLFVSGITLILGISRWIQIVNLLIPSEVIRGIQLGVGYKLALTGTIMAFCVGSKYDPKLSLASNVLPLWDSNTKDGLGLTIAVLFLFVVTLNWSAAKKADEGKPSATRAPSELKEDPKKTKARLYEQEQSVMSLAPVSFAFFSITEEKNEGTEAEPEHYPLRVYLPEEINAASTPEKQAPGPSGTSYRDIESAGPAAPCSTPTKGDGSDVEGFKKRESDSTGTDVTNTTELTEPDPSPWAWLSRLLLGVPSALLAVILGVVIACVFHKDALRNVRLGPSIPKVIDVNTWPKWHASILELGVRELPITVLNSVVAVVALSSELFPNVPMSCAEVANSVGIMNFLGCWFGALPSCHGSGGLAAQARFGATSGAAPMLIGALKVILGLVFGSSLFQVLQHFPNTILGSMLIIAGLELAGTIQFETTKLGTFVMLLTAVVGQGLNDISVGCAAGLGACFLLKLRLEGWRWLWARLQEVGREIQKDYKEGCCCAPRPPPPPRKHARSSRRHDHRRRRRTDSDADSMDD